MSQRTIYGCDKCGKETDDCTQTVEYVFFYWKKESGGKAKNSKGGHFCLKCFEDLGLVKKG